MVPGATRVNHYDKSEFLGPVVEKFFEFFRKSLPGKVFKVGKRL